ncbi:MAG: macro domain-containing protein, partial [Enterococcus gilvus]
HEEEKLLYSAYEAVYQLAQEYKLESLAVPVLSAGIYGYPKKAAARVLYEVAGRSENQGIATTIVVFEESWLEIFAALQQGS